MEGSVVSYRVRLESKVRKEGSDWLTWCLPLDVMTQASTRKKALKALEEAVQLWFESCIERGVLNDALHEAGFRMVKAGEQTPQGASLVQVAGDRVPAPDNAFLRPGRPEYIEVSIPAFIAAQHLGAQSASR